MKLKLDPWFECSSYQKQIQYVGPLHQGYRFVTLILIVKNTYMHISRLLESTGLCLSTKYTHLHETDQSEGVNFHLRSRPKAF
jgi:hypothetical protein